MRFFLLLLFFCSHLVWADLAHELVKVQQDPKRYAHELSQVDPQDRDAVFWFKSSLVYYRLDNKETALNHLQTALSLPMDPTLRVRALEQLALVYGVMYRNNEKALLSLHDAEQLLNSLKSTDKPSLQASLYESFAQAYNQSGHIIEALRYAELSTSIATEHNLPEPELQARLIAGRLALQQNNFLLAQQHLSRALALAIQLDRSHSLASIYLRLGLAYRKLSQYPVALEHLQKAEALYSNDQAQGPLISVWLHLADTHLQLGQLTQAHELLERALTSARVLQDSHHIARAFYFKALMAIQQSELEEAKTWLNQAIQLFRQLGHLGQQQEIGLAYAEVSILLRDFETAAQALIEFSPQEHAPDFLKLRHAELESSLNAALEQWREAYLANEKVLALKEAQVNLQHQDVIQTLDLRLKNQEQLTKIKQLQSQLNWIWQSLVGILVFSVALLAGHFYRRNSRKRKLTALGEAVPVSPHPLTDSLKSALHHIHRQPNQLTYLQIISLKDTEQAMRQHGTQWLARHWQQRMQQCQMTLLVDQTLDREKLILIWQANRIDKGQLEAEMQSLFAHFQKNGPSDIALTSVEIPITQLWATPWHNTMLVAIWELYWFSLDQAYSQQSSHKDYYLQINALQQHPFSWQASNIRADILNAYQLGLWQLCCHGEVLASNPVDHSIVSMR